MNLRHFGRKLSSSLYYAVPDPDLEMGGGGGSSRPFDGGGGWFPKKIFLALQASVWSKNKGGGRAGMWQGRNVVVVEASSQMSGKKTYSLILPFSVQRK